VDNAGKADILLNWLISNTISVTEGSPLPSLKECRRMLIWDQNELCYWLCSLQQRYLIENAVAVHNIPNGSNRYDMMKSEVIVSDAGWTMAKGLIQNKFFIALPFIMDESYNSKKVIEVIKAVSNKMGYESGVVGQDHAGLIIEKIMFEIRHAKAVIADLTTNNANVYWEAGFAKGLEKDVILLFDEEHKDQPRFDLQGFNQIRYKSSDLEKLEETLYYRLVNLFKK
jgi:hypothetical protein